MYNNVPWLSRGQVLQRFVECLNEVNRFLDMNGKKQEFPHLDDFLGLANSCF